MGPIFHNPGSNALSMGLVSAPQLICAVIAIIVLGPGAILLPGLVFPFAAWGCLCLGRGWLFVLPVLYLGWGTYEVLDVGIRMGFDDEDLGYGLIVISAFNFPIAMALDTLLLYVSHWVGIKIPIPGYAVTAVCCVVYQLGVLYLARRLQPWAARYIKRALEPRMED